MAQEIDYAVREAYSMQLSTEQSIRFVMRMVQVDRDTAKAAVDKFLRGVLQAH